MQLLGLVAFHDVHGERFIDHVPSKNAARSLIRGGRYTDNRMCGGSKQKTAGFGSTAIETERPIFGTNFKRLFEGHRTIRALNEGQAVASMVESNQTNHFRCRQNHTFLSLF